MKEGGDTKDKLSKVGAPRLADALLKLAVKNNLATDAVVRLIATPKEMIRRITARIADLNWARYAPSIYGI